MYSMTNTHPLLLPVLIRDSLIYQTAKKICLALKEKGFEAYIVGGAVRDFIILSHKIPHDLDIATSAQGQDIFSLFPSTQFVGEQFGVCLLQYNNFTFEVATFRKDGVYLDKRRPESVRQGTLLDDSNRRDFTINALYYDPEKETILDIHGGLQDIEQKILRCVGEASLRFQEDVLRILRALRFSSNLNFNLEKKTEQALKEYAHELTHVSKERILLEFQKSTNFKEFVYLICSHLNLNLFFSDTSCFSMLKIKNRREKVLSPCGEPAGSIFKHVPFFHFILRISYLYQLKVNSNLFLDLKKWPLSSEDNSLCSHFLKFYSFENFMEEKKLSTEECELFFYIYFVKIKKNHPSFSNLFLEHMLTIFQKRELLSLLQLMKQKEFLFPNKDASEKIGNELTQQNYPQNLMQNYIDLYHYSFFMGKNLLNLEKFVVENFNLMGKINELKKAWSKWV